MLEDDAAAVHTAGDSDYEDEACTLLSNARIELQELNDRWKQAEKARLKQVHARMCLYICWFVLICICKQKRHVGIKL